MNSVILTGIVAFFSKIPGWFCESAIGKLFFRICGAISRSWERSLIVGLLKRDEREEISGSVAVKIARIPITFAEFLKKKFGEFLETSVKESFICSWAKVYFQNCLAINTRFFGMMFLGCGLFYTLAKFVDGNGIVISGAICSIVGVLFLLVNYNLICFINHSAVVEFIKDCLGFKGLDLEIYSENALKGRLRLVLSFIAGAAAGVALAMIGIMGAALPIGIFAVIAVMYSPIIGVFFAVFLAPAIPTMALAGVVILTFLSLLIKSLTDKSFKWSFDAVGFGILTLLCVLLISTVFSFSLKTSAMVWMMYLVFLSFYIAVVNTVESKEQLYALLKVFAISGTLIALYGIMQYLFGWTTTNAWIDETMFEDSTMRVYSTLGNPNVLGEYLLLVLPVAIVWFFKLELKSFTKWAYAAMSAVLLLCLVLTQSRGCWIGFMMTVFVFVTFYEGRWWGIIPIFLCILPFVIPQTMIDRFLSIGNMEDSSTSYRVYIWMGTLGMLKHYWLGGIGMGEGAFNQVYPFFSYNAIQAPHSHNLFLQLTVEAGIPALITFIVIMIVFLKKIHGAYRLCPKKNIDAAMPLAIASGVIGFLIQSMFDYTFYNYRVMAIFFMVLALGMVFVRLGRKEAGNND